MSENNIVILNGARTAMGGFQGSLAPMSAPELGGACIREAVARAGLQAADVEDVVMGCVLPAGLKQGPARQAMRLAGLPDSTGATTINKLCGSGMRATMFCHDMLKAGSHDIVVSGGMESMSNAPYILDKARGGYRMGHGQVADHMFLDGLEDAETGRLMGAFAQDVADQRGIGREQMDNFAIESLKRAQAAITAANASSISDGASALVLARESVARERGLQPLARILGHATNSRHPSEFTVAPIGATEKLLKKVGWSVADVDLFEVNEAFAMVAMMPMLDLGIPHEKLNIHGGACALGHPIGSTGSRIILTLIHALKRTGGTRGVASLCIGGGEATAVAVELL
jgi:acetyl-CoA C-acetyltransferase